MALVNINIKEFENPPAYNQIELSYNITDNVCNNTKTDYQISNSVFDSSSIIYEMSNNLADEGWYSDGSNKANWDGESIIEFIPCVI